jgi:hypothetical protein
MGTANPDPAPCYASRRRRDGCQRRAGQLLAPVPASINVPQTAVAGGLPEPLSPAAGRRPEASLATCPPAPPRKGPCHQGAATPGTVPCCWGQERVTATRPPLREAGAADVVVAGGGISGLTAALMLAKAGALLGGRPGRDARRQRVAAAAPLSSAPLACHSTPPAQQPLAYSFSPE